MTNYAFKTSDFLFLSRSNHTTPHPFKKMISINLDSIINHAHTLHMLMMDITKLTATAQFSHHLISNALTTILTPVQTHQRNRRAKNHNNKNHANR